MRRQCGDCQLCCKLLPVRSLAKPGGKRCDHQSFSVGCKIYHKLAQVSPECAVWNCRWLVNDDCADVRRPDRGGYVIDILPDFVRARDDASGQEQNWEAVQVWVDHPDAVDDPGLQAYLIRRAHEGKVAIIRTSPRTGYVLIAPPMATDGKWHKTDNGPTERTHTPMEIMEALANR